MTQKFLTSVNRPFALVKSQGNSAPGRRPPSSMAWIEFKNPDGSFDGGEIYLVQGSGVMHPYLKPSRWRFMYKRQKRFQPEDILFSFSHPRGVSRPEKTEYWGGPSLREVTAVKRTLPKPPSRYLTPVKDIPSYAVIARCIHERGDIQREALAELARRGLWLSEQQKQEAGLT